MKQNGFVLAEFVIALPLLILLLFSLGQMTYKIFSIARTQSADYVLKNEAQRALQRITDDAKSAHSVEISQAIGSYEIQEIFFNYHVAGNDLSKDYFKKDYSSFTNDIVDLIYTHRYTVHQPQTGGRHIYAQRMDKEKGKKVTSPITGGNFFGDTSVTKLKFSLPKKNILHIELEMQSLVTEKKFKVATSVFMSACESAED